MFDQISALARYYSRTSIYTGFPKSIYQLFVIITSSSTHVRNILTNYPLRRSSNHIIFDIHYNTIFKANRINDRTKNGP